MTDVFIVRAVTLTICVCTATIVGFVCFLAVTSTAVPDQLDRLASLFAGAIIGFLVKTSVGGDEPTPVVVQNETDNPVPVEPGE